MSYNWRAIPGRVGRCALFPFALARAAARWAEAKWFEPLNNRLRKFAFIDILDRLGKLTVLLAVVFYFLEAPDRKLAGQRDAWLVINSALGQTGSGGRIQALEKLCNEGVDISGLDVSSAWLERVRLENASMKGANFSGAKLARADLRGANLEGVDFRGADLRRANLNNANCWRTQFQGADLRGARGATMDQLRFAIFDNETKAPLGLEQSYEIRNLQAEFWGNGFLVWSQYTFDPHEMVEALRASRTYPEFYSALSSLDTEHDMPGMWEHWLDDPALPQSFDKLLTLLGHAPLEGSPR